MFCVVFVTSIVSLFIFIACAFFVVIVILLSSLYDPLSQQIDK